MTAAVGANATAVAQAQTDATAAKTAATQASSDAGDAKTAVANLGTTYIPQDSIGTANGVVGYTSDGSAIVRSLRGTNNNSDTYFALGSWDTAPAAGNVTVALRFGGVSPTKLYIRQNNISYEMFSGFNTVATPDVDGGIAIAEAGRAVSGVFSQTAVTVTSDATHKTVVGDLSDASYADGAKLLTAIYSLDSETFKLNSSIAAKGEDDARIHAGFIAQKVQAALTEAGLDPSDYALWTNSPVYETVKTDTGKKDDNGQPVYSVSSVQKTDSNGQPLTIQMLRYEQIFCVLFEAAKQKIAAQDTALTALMDRVATLEAKAASAATTTTTGSAT
ncbi:tail fiber domain-containing protein [Acetobacter cerevisiae]|uniref:tail fiber domain-containing protein n=1 Tax=Acetobacter cerevisiae TaxID=178900 RepID=UPI00209CECC8|nr:tail fiber domain-containing protein [Acetobacter cerevisiae]MCP1278883.1 tail fiber domain-containing protein [Acetobacter cerevisiae]